MITPDSTVFLVDVDNTLLDNDHIQADLKRHLEREFGAACRDRYWAILERSVHRTGLSRLPRRLAALPRRAAARNSPAVDVFLSGRLSVRQSALSRRRSMFSSASAAGGRRSFCPTAMSSFSRARSSAPGIAEAVDGHVLIYIHKEAGARGCRAALPGPPLCPGRRQAADPGGGQGDLGRPGDDGIAAPGPVRQ